MSSFLLNVVRRGAGLPARTIQAPPPSPFGPEIHKHGEEEGLREVQMSAGGLSMAKEYTTGNASGQVQLRANSSDELPLEVPKHPVPSIQRFSGAKSIAPIQPSIREPATTISTPSLGPTPAPWQQEIQPLREAEVAPLKPPQDLSSGVPLFHTEHEVITEIEVERGRHNPSPAAQKIEPAGEIGRPTNSVPPSPPKTTKEPSEGPLVPPAEPPAALSRAGTLKTHEPAPPAPMIHPAPAESHTLLQFPKTTPVSSPMPPSQPPIHVRIGRVEVRGTTAPTPTPAKPGQPAALGFDGYYRIRTYRS